ncbi:MAG: hypothetical protein FJ320_04565 [SAR202 cluster bacterium]|nr:hypothetical protein [SAR202 cluster bacterium]
MAFSRIYTGPDGKSRFEDLKLNFNPADLTKTGEFSGGAKMVLFRRQPPGVVQNWHPAPKKQYVITVQGMAEIEAGTGEKRRFGPGDVMLADDLTGQGHITRVVGNQTRISICVVLD